MKIEHIFSSCPHLHSYTVTSLNPRAVHQDPGTARSGGGTRALRGVPTELCVCSLWPVLGALAATRYPTQGSLSRKPHRTDTGSLRGCKEQREQGANPWGTWESGTAVRPQPFSLFFFLKTDLVKSFKRMCTLQRRPPYDVFICIVLTFFTIHHQASETKIVSSPVTDVSASVQVSVSILYLNMSKPHNIK